MSNRAAPMLFHGSSAVLKVGEVVLPAAQLGGEVCNFKGLSKPKVAYATADLRDAMYFAWNAAWVSGGAEVSVYEVRALGRVKCRNISPRYERRVARVEHQCREGFEVISVVKRRNVVEGKIGACAKDFWES